MTVEDLLLKTISNFIELNELKLLNLKN